MWIWANKIVDTIEILGIWGIETMWALSEIGLTFLIIIILWVLILIMIVKNIFGFREMINKK